MAENADDEPGTAVSRPACSRNENSEIPKFPNLSPRVSRPSRSSRSGEMREGSATNEEVALSAERTDSHPLRDGLINGRDSIPRACV